MSIEAGEKGRQGLECVKFLFLIFCVGGRDKKKGWVVTVVDWSKTAPRQTARSVKMGYIS